MIDTHSHVYAEEFDDDFKDVINRATNAGVEKIVLANVDMSSLEKVIACWKNDPDTFIPTIGLHPTEVNNDFMNILNEMNKIIDLYPFKALGETGLDLYWDKTYLKQQIESFQWHIDKSIEHDLPLIIHIRDSFEEIKNVLKENKSKPLRGVIHSFTGSEKDAFDIIETGNFMFGINGIVTFKNSKLAEVVKAIGIERLVLETDAPYLAPVPFRGKRNEPAYMDSTKNKLAEIFMISPDEVDKITTKNAKHLFNIQ